jgi:hypothetical protein
VNNAAFKQLWAQYKPTAPPLSRNQPPNSGDIDDAIDALVNHGKDNNKLHLDEYEQWRKYELKWTKEQHNSGNVIQY